MNKQNYKARTCTCLIPNCVKCLGVNCKTKGCPVHTDIAKLRLARRMEMSIYYRETDRINTTLNFQAAMGDTNRDADKHSRLLQEYHRALWSKPLPNGNFFNLVKLKTNCMLLYKDPSGNSITLSSDRAVPTFSSWRRLEHIIKKIKKSELVGFINIAESIGGITIWPSTKVDGKNTINAERGLNRKICDRLDLTIECIRRYYNNERSPLYFTLKRYVYFFDLFIDFKGYIDFFLLQDFVSDNYKSTKIAPPYDDFNSSPVPSTKEEYLDYLIFMTGLVNSRNTRIKNYARSGKLNAKA